MKLDGLNLFAIIIWLSGYFQTKYPFEKSVVSVPKWLFLLCGAPKTKKLPQNIMSSRGLGFQITGVLMFIYSYTVKDLPFSESIWGNPIAGAAVSLVIASIIVFLIARYYQTQSGKS